MHDGIPYVGRVGVEEVRGWGSLVHAGLQKAVVIHPERLRDSLERIAESEEFLEVSDESIRLVS